MRSPSRPHRAAQALDGRQGEVVADARIHHQPLLAPVLGHEGHPGPDPFARAARERPPEEPRLAPLGRVEAHEDARELAAPRAHQAEEAQDLALADGEAHALNDAGRGEALDLEHGRRARLGCPGGIHGREFTADHDADHLGDVELGDGSLPTRRPSRRTATRSEIRRTSWRMWEM
jgi:hypothetical protein